MKVSQPGLVRCMLLQTAIGNVSCPSQRVLRNPAPEAAAAAFCTCGTAGLRRLCVITKASVGGGIFVQSEGLAGWQLSL